MTDVRTILGWEVAERVQEYVGNSADTPYVTYADHVEALRQAEQALRGELTPRGRAFWEQQAERRYEQGQRDALAAAVQRVEAIPADGGWISNGKVWRFQAIAAIKGGE